MVTKEPYNLAYFVVKRMEYVRQDSNARLPYGMLLTRLFRHIMKKFPHLNFEIYEVVNRVMHPLDCTQKSQNDHGKANHSTSTASSQCHPHSKTPSPKTFINSFEPLENLAYDLPSPSRLTNELLFIRQAKLLDHTRKLHKEVREGFKVFGKALKDLVESMKK